MKTSEALRAAKPFLFSATKPPVVDTRGWFTRRIMGPLPADRLYGAAYICVALDRAEKTYLWPWDTAAFYQARAVVHSRINGPTLIGHLSKLTSTFYDRLSEEYFVVRDQWLGELIQELEAQGK